MWPSSEISGPALVLSACGLNLALRPNQVTSGLFNPTFAATGIGDLTSKHGKLAQLQDTEAATYVDTTASIIYDAAPGSKGNKWIVGRSIVIQRSDGSNWVCANIGSAGMAATVKFPEGPGLPKGGIQLFQARARLTLAQQPQPHQLQRPTPTLTLTVRRNCSRRAPRTARLWPWTSWACRHLRTISILASPPCEPLPYPNEP